jgi:hypothetical protein
VASALPNVDLPEARSLWGYLDWVRGAHLEPSAAWGNDDLIRQAMDLPKEEWNLVDLARELRLGPFEAKKLETSLKIFEGGAYRITTTASPEGPVRRRKKAKPVVDRPAKKPEPEGEAAPPTESPEDHAPKVAEAPKPPATRSSETAGKRCVPHDALGVDRHACGAWLCKACVEAGDVCPGCREPVPPTAKEAPRRRDKDDPARDFARL